MSEAEATLRNAVNIGPVLARELAAAGFTSLEEIRAVGYIEALRRLRTANPDRDCVNSALAIAGAIRGVRWTHLPKEERERLAADVRAAFGES